MIRLILIGLAIFVFFIPVGLPMMLLVGILGCISQKARDTVARKYMSFLMGLVCRLAGAKITAVGTENMSPDTPVLYVSNHRSYVDIFVEYQFIHFNCGTVAKQEWTRIPLLKDWMRLLHCVFLDRRSLRTGLAVSHQVIAELESGNSFWVYPEGTRNHKDTLLPFRDGAMRPAFQTGVPIVPVTFVHTDDIYELHRPFVRPAEITVVFGKPLPTRDLDRHEAKALAKQVRDQIQDTYDLYV